MLPEEKHLAALKLNMADRQYLFTAFSHMVRNLSGRKVDHFPTQLLGPITPVQLLGVHKEPFIEEPNFLERLAPHKQASSHNPVHSLRFVIRTVEDIVSLQDVALGTPLLQECAFHIGCAQVRKAAARGLYLPVGIEKLRAQGSRLVVSLHIGHHIPQGISHNLSIWVEEKDILTITESNTLIIASGEAKILLIGYQMNLGKLLPEHPYAAIAGGVIYHDELRRKPMALTGAQAFQDRVQAKAEEILHIPADDDDGQIMSFHDATQLHKPPICSGA